MKIAVNSRMFQNAKAGIPYYIQSLYESMQRHHPQNEYLFLQTNASKQLGTTKVANNWLTRRVPWLFDILFILPLIRQTTPDVLHGPAHILPLVRSKHTKYVATIHDLAFLHNPEYYNAMFNIYYKIMLKISIAKADHIIAISHNTKADVLAHYPKAKDKITVIYNGIHEFYLEDRQTDRVVEQKYFLTMTTHPRRKNTFTILRAFAMSAAMKHGQKMVIVGILTDAHISELKEEIEKLGISENVVLFGYASEAELYSLYRHAECFVYASFYEGFGFPILEAMASKTPVIASNTSSMIELVPDKNWLIDPASAQAIADKMDEAAALTSEQRDALVAKNYTFASNFRWEKTSDEMEQLLTRLMTNEG